jgi:hypothetical protein
MNIKYLLLPVLLSPLFNDLTASELLEAENPATEYTEEVTGDSPATKECPPLSDSVRDAIERFQSRLESKSSRHNRKSKR